VANDLFDANAVIFLANAALHRISKTHVCGIGKKPLRSLRGRTRGEARRVNNCR